MSSEKSSTAKRGRAAGAGKSGKGASSASAGGVGKRRKAAGKESGAVSTGKKQRKVAKDGASKTKRSKSVAAASGDGAGAAVKQSKPKKKKEVALGPDGKPLPKPPKESVKVAWQPRKVWGVRTAPFRRLLNFYGKKIANMRMKRGVPRALQAVVEADVVESIRKGAEVASHAKRTTVNASDLELQDRLDTSKAGENADMLAWAKIASKPSKARKTAVRTAKTPKPKAALPADGSVPAPKEKKPKKSKAKAEASSSSSSAAAASDTTAAMDANAVPTPTIAVPTEIAIAA